MSALSAVTTNPIITSINIDEIYCSETFQDQRREIRIVKFEFSFRY